MRGNKGFRDVNVLVRDIAYSSNEEVTDEYSANWGIEFANYLQSSSALIPVNRSDVMLIKG